MTVSVPGGGQYRLLYSLKNDGIHDGSFTNSWQARITAIDNSFPAIVLEYLQDSDSFGWTGRELPFSLPEGTAAIRLTFEFRQVRSGPPDDGALFDILFVCWMHPYGAKFVYGNRK